MTDDPIERLRAHVEKHKHRTGLYVSTDGLTALLDELERWKAHAIGLEHKVSQAMKQYNEMGAEIERLTKERDEARQTLSDWTTDIGVRGFARRSELDAAKAEVERLRGLFEAQKIRSVENARQADDLKARADELKAQRDELTAQVERLLAKEAARIGEALVK
jgi:multidrug resistance efflux pump